MVSVALVLEAVALADLVDLAAEVVAPLAAEVLAAAGKSKQHKKMGHGAPFFFQLFI